MKKSIHAIQRWKLAVLCVPMLLAACGGDDNVTIAKALPTAPAVTHADGSVSVPVLPVSGATLVEEKRLADAGVRAMNKQCATAKQAIEPATTTYVVLFEVSETEVEKAQSVGFTALTRDQDWSHFEGLFECATKGY